jgi:hypothetical protein
MKRKILWVLIICCIMLAACVQIKPETVIEHETTQPESENTNEPVNEEFGKIEITNVQYVDVEHSNKNEIIIEYSTANFDGEYSIEYRFDKGVWQACKGAENDIVSNDIMQEALRIKVDDTMDCRVRFTDMENGALLNEVMIPARDSIGDLPEIKIEVTEINDQGVNISLIGSQEYDTVWMSIYTESAQSTVDISPTETEHFFELLEDSETVFWLNIEYVDNDIEYVISSNTVKVTMPANGGEAIIQQEDSPPEGDAYIEFVMYDYLDGIVIDTRSDMDREKLQIIYSIDGGPWKEATKMYDRIDFSTIAANIPEFKPQSCCDIRLVYAYDYNTVYDTYYVPAVDLDANYKPILEVVDRTPSSITVNYRHEGIGEPQRTRLLLHDPDDFSIEYAKSMADKESGTFTYTVGPDGKALVPGKTYHLAVTFEFIDRYKIFYGYECFSVEVELPEE